MEIGEELADELTLATLSRDRRQLAAMISELRTTADRLRRSEAHLAAAQQVAHCGSWEADAGAEFARAYFERDRGATAVVLANDALASGFMRVAHKAGVRMPGDLSIVGFDGLPEGERLWPALTSVAQPMREMGAAACRRLFEVIDTPGQVQTIEFPMRLIVRESTAPARIAARSVIAG